MSSVEARSAFFRAMWVLVTSVAQSQVVQVMVEGIAVALLAAVWRLLDHGIYGEIVNVLAGLNSIGVMVYILLRTYRRLLR